ncbi:protoporphyrinogen/coproporphyrinogen oxidase [Cecembia calidifontis]|jgi:protoporphyrinogen oxidase|uniref:Protoporphyrinogen oxidase n=1 Tax=Cecembia calidifontis TaxID=1187080 RepID=A0A4Q7PDE5_9BACT|nr:NAD(P)/FAD-dependent oxidoreductase [Cecembia calidifontis]RZS97630.1 protoporphyrinogen oxidase [Cecembia calidifontis]
MKNDQKIYIIGAGISGLIAAYELERAGFSPVILEASDKVGGRVRTDEYKGFLLDRGFQVLLTAYPEAQRYLDYQALNLKQFDPGAVILKPGNSFIIDDPLRQPSKFINMAFSPVGTLMDKIKIYQLTQKLKQKTEEEIFSEPSTTTIQFLRDFGFSEKIINNFFKPFFRGIFLENELSTSSRMFKFVFKMFSLGYAAVPENGMQAIPDQLKSKLTKSQIRFNTPVKKVEGRKIYLETGEELDSDAIIIATRPDKLMEQLQGQFKPSRKVVNLYYSLNHSFIAQPKIALVTDDQFLINNLVFMTDVSKAYSKNNKALLSVSIIKPVEIDEKLAKLVAIELSALTKINAEYFEHLQSYEIEEALPQVEDMGYSLPSGNTKIQDGVYLAGDYLLNGSINAAMTAGRKAAEAVILSFQPTH